MQDNLERVVLFMEIAGNLYEVICSIDIPMPGDILRQEQVQVEFPYMFGKDENGSLAMTPFHMHSNEKVIFKTEHIISVSAPSRGICEKYDERVSVVKAMTNNPEYLKQVLRQIGKEETEEEQEEQTSIPEGRTVH